MSRLAKKSIPVPEGVSVEERDGMLTVKGPKGARVFRLPPFVALAREPSGIMVKRESGEKQARANQGTAWSLIQNALVGVTTGFKKVLEIEGVGYRAALDGKELVLSLGYVNPVRFKIPEGALISVEKNVITISGIDKELVGRVAAEIRAQKVPEPYKGKGIRYAGEVVRRKVGKKAVVATG